MSEPERIEQPNLDNVNLATNQMLVIANFLKWFSNDDFVSHDYCNILSGLGTVLEDKAKSIHHELEKAGYQCGLD